MCLCVFIWLCAENADLMEQEIQVGANISSYSASAFALLGSNFTANRAAMNGGAVFQVNIKASSPHLIRCNDTFQTHFVAFQASMTLDTYSQCTLSQGRLILALTLYSKMHLNI